jgi:hypothetical protein
MASRKPGPSALGLGLSHGTSFTEESNLPTTLVELPRTPPCFGKDPLVHLGIYAERVTRARAKPGTLTGRSGEKVWHYGLPTS